MSSSDSTELSNSMGFATLALYLSAIFFYTNARRIRRQQHASLGGSSTTATTGRKPSFDDNVVVVAHTSLVPMTPTLDRNLDANAFTDHQFSESPQSANMLKKRVEDDQRMLLSPISSSISLVEPIAKKIDSTT